MNKNLLLLLTIVILVGSAVLIYMMNIKNTNKDKLFIFFFKDEIRSFISTNISLGYPTEQNESTHANHRSSEHIKNLSSIYNLSQQSTNMHKNDQQKENDKNSNINPKKIQENDRFYCMVPFVWNEKYKPNHKKLYEEIMRTWGKRCDTIRFFVDVVDKQLPPNVLTVPMKRKAGSSMCFGAICPHIWEKVWRAWIWVADNEIHKAEWFVKVDDDTYLFPENIKSYIKEKAWLPTDPHYFGHKLYHEFVPLIAGTVVIFSKNTLEQVVPVYKKMPSSNSIIRKCADVPGGMEDVITSLCLKSIGIHAEETVDLLGREMVMLSKPKHMLKWKKESWWYWQRKPDDRGDGLRCCSTKPFAFHGNKKIGSHDKLETVFYHNQSLTDWRDATEAVYFEFVRNNLLRYYTNDNHGSNIWYLKIK